MLQINQQTYDEMVARGDEWIRLTAACNVHISLLEKALKELAPCASCKFLKECRFYGKDQACAPNGIRYGAWEFNRSKFMDTGRAIK